EAGKLELNPQTVQLTPLINEVIGTAGQLAEQNKNRLVVDAQESLGALTVDPMRLRQILLNLLSNVAHRIGASLSYAASAHHRRICCCQLTGHYRAPRGSSAFNPAWPAIHRRKSTRRGHQYRHRGGRECIPDGYTLLMAGASNAINATFYDKLNYNFIRDIAPVAGIMRAPLVMVVVPSFPAKTVPEFIAYAKANPGKINMASPGNGT